MRHACSSAGCADSSRRGEFGIFEALRRERKIHEAFGDEYGYLCLVLRVGAAPS